jgi:hypothetical protein
LTSAQQAQIRTNISAASQADVNTLNSNIAHQQKFQIGDTFNLDGAQFPFRTLGNLGGIYFRYRLPKPVADDVTSFTVAISVQSPCWSNCGVATIPINATASNISILDKRTISFSVVPSETIANSGFGISELNANITFT